MAMLWLGAESGVRCIFWSIALRGASGVRAMRWMIGGMIWVQLSIAALGAYGLWLGPTHMIARGVDILSWVEVAIIVGLSLFTIAGCFFFRSHGWLEIGLGLFVRAIAIVSISEIITY